MLQRHLHAWAETVDERAFRVRLSNARDIDANRAFDEGAAIDRHIDAAIQDGLDRRMRAAGIAIAPGARALDVCAGRGALGRLLATRFGARVVCVDVSSSQLAAIGPRGAATVYCAGDVLHLPFASDSFDLVIGNSFLHHLNDVPSAVAELARVARPNGTVALLHEPNVNANFWQSFPWSIVKDTSPIDGFTDLWMFTPADLERLFAGAGLGRITIRGTGVVSSVLVNWYLIALGKLGLDNTAAAAVAFHARHACNTLELASAGRRWADRAPSLIAIGRKP